MSIVMKVLAVVFITVAIMFFIKRLVESIFNLKISLRQKSYYDVSNQRHGIVLNKKTKRLEADQSVILPF
jgi:hypothetical protein